MIDSSVIYNYQEFRGMEGCSKNMSKSKIFLHPHFSEGDLEKRKSLFSGRKPHKTQIPLLTVGNFLKKSASVRRGTKGDVKNPLDHVQFVLMI